MRIQRQVLVGAAVGVGFFVGMGVLLWAGSQGLLGGSHGTAKRLMVVAEQAMRRGQLPEAQAKLEELISTSPDAPWIDKTLFTLGQVYEQQQLFNEAQIMYRLLLERFPSSSWAAQAQTRLGTVNVALLFSPTITASDTSYEVTPGDTLGRIAAAYGTTVELVKRANGLSSDVIRPKQMLKLPKGHFNIVVDKSQNQLLLSQDNTFFKVYSVATGENGSTPTGAFTVTSRIVNPTWYKQGAVVPPDSPENILGTRWLGLDKPGYGIHGSVDPTSIGQQVTAGCVRMTNADVEELFAIVPAGTQVTIVD